MDLEGEVKWEGGKKCSKMCVQERERAVLCGGTEKGEIKLEWFVSMANWDGVRMEKLVCSC